DGTRARRRCTGAVARRGGRRPDGDGRGRPRRVRARRSGPAGAGAGGPGRPARTGDGPTDVDDLARILAYHDAVDARTGITELGPDLLVVPFWTPRFCAAVVRAAELVGYARDPD